MRVTVAMSADVVSFACSVAVRPPLTEGVADGEGAAITENWNTILIAGTPDPDAMTNTWTGSVVCVAPLPTAKLTVVVVTPAPSVAVPKVTVTPAGTPDVDSTTLPVKPPPQVIVTVADWVPPTGSRTVDGSTLIDSVPTIVGGVGSLLPPQAASAPSAQPRGRHAGSHASKGVKALRTSGKGLGATRTGARCDAHC